MENNQHAALLALLNNPTTPPEMRSQLIQLMNMSNIQSLQKAEKENEKELEENSDDPPKDFQFIDGDDYEKTLVEYLKNTQGTNSLSKSEMVSLMMKISFEQGDYATYLKRIFTGVEVKTGLCRKVLNRSSDVGYECLDCRKDPTCIICAACFENSNHKGHR